MVAAAIITCSRLFNYPFSGVCKLVDIKPTIRGDNGPTDFTGCFVQLQFMCMMQSSDQSGRHSVD